jgi:hypothetical protein
MDDETLIRVRQANQAFKLTIAQNLGRIWSDVLQEPLPDDLQRLIRKLERGTRPKQTQFHVAGTEGIRRTDRCVRQDGAAPSNEPSAISASPDRIIAEETVTS